MKYIYKPILLLTTIFAIIGIFAACTKDNNGSGQPVIKYVRVTNPVSSDSLLVGAFQGNLIAIVGENLQNTVEIWFNDQKAVLTPTYITRRSRHGRSRSPDRSVHATTPRCA